MHDDEPILFLLSKDPQLSGWLLSRYDADHGEHEYRACASEARAHAYAKRVWGVQRWEHRGDFYASYIAHGKEWL